MNVLASGRIYSKEGGYWGGNVSIQAATWQEALAKLEVISGTLSLFGFKFIYTNLTSNLQLVPDTVILAFDADGMILNGKGLAVKGFKEFLRVHQAIFTNNNE